MKSEIDRTTYRIKDLGEQPQAKYLLRFDSPSLPGQPGLSTVVWVDRVEEDEDGAGATASLEDGRIVAQFSYDHTWFLIARENIDLVTVRDIYEHERASIAEREAAKRSMQQAYQEAQEETYRPTPKGPPVPPSQPPVDGIDWNEELRNL